MRKSSKSAVLDLIHHSSGAVSHNDLLKQLGADYNRVTIYRSLDRLVEEGEIHKVIDLDGVSKYAQCDNCGESHHHRHDHIHFSCTQCGEVTCLSHVIPTFTLPKTYQVKEVNFTVSGLCPNCGEG